MDYFIQFINKQWLYVLVPLIVAATSIVYKKKKHITYSYSLAGELLARGAGTRHPYQKITSIMSFLLLCLLALICARPQLVDSRTEVTVEGIDMVLALDLSGSMSMRDFEHDPRTRIDIAKDEAIQFIKKRSNDAMGLVIFGNDAISRCPITYDKKLLEDTVKELYIGIIDYNGTHLSTALVTAASRLKHSKAKSKVIILLTDGVPSENDINPDTAIQVAQKMGIKIYTIGIGQDKPWTYIHPLFGAVSMPPTVDATLLKRIAQETQGQFFLAHNAQEMHAIYDTIDQLEKSEIVTPIFSNQRELGFLGIAVALGMLSVLIIVSTFIWFGL